ncbi:hypothetical protein GP475_06875 [Corynebacterium poyangense]|uniref:Uncharacterized protein n=1 Tax=Corynebacterium poyangense TaxID=2684405 RepID=A0A7H0SPB3_9CORY|nr:hypothetical protein [Corynebacterium poyangense]QNQ90388.1 hypothetical protein GP475_06875 [Corynebacterium poyangense]
MTPDEIAHLDEAEQLALFDDLWRLYVPLAMLEKAGPYRRTSRTKAVGMPMIESNPACLKSLTVTDVDNTDIRDLALSSGLPAPTWAVAHPGR